MKKVPFTQDRVIEILQTRQIGSAAAGMGVLMAYGTVGGGCVQHFMLFECCRLSAIQNAWEVCYKFWIGR